MEYDKNIFPDCFHCRNDPLATLLKTVKSKMIARFPARYPNPEDTSEVKQFAKYMELCAYYVWKSGKFQMAFKCDCADNEKKLYPDIDFTNIFSLVQDDSIMNAIMERFKSTNKRR